MTTAGIVILYVLLTAVIAGIAVVIALLIRDSSPPQDRTERIGIDLLSEIDERLARFELLLNEASRTRARLEEVAREFRARDTQDALLRESEARARQPDSGVSKPQPYTATATPKSASVERQGVASAAAHSELSPSQPGTGGDIEHETAATHPDAPSADQADRDSSSVEPVGARRELSEREIRISGYLKDGKSVGEIAREMRMWKGEVELVAALLATPRNPSQERR
jgi:hypothetical protein